MTSPSSGAALLERARRGDGDALTALFERHAGKLLAFIRLRLGAELRRRVESRDVLQETMWKACQRFEQLRGDGTTSLMGWLIRIAENEVRDQAAFHRRQRRDAGREVGIEALAEDGRELATHLRTATSRLVWDERAARLEEALEALPGEQREVVVLRRFEELSYPEIGRRLDKSPDACRMLFARAMATLTARLAEDGTSS